MVTEMSGCGRGEGGRVVEGHGCEEGAEEGGVGERNGGRLVRR